jgi:uncharacterized protein (TIGR00296 family)
MLSDADGAHAVRLARSALDHAYGTRSSPEVARDEDSRTAPWTERRGVFVTLRRYPSHELRGCIGFPLPVLPLGRALAEAAVAAAREDPRFPPVAPDELARVAIEVSVLTPPETLPPGNPEETVRSVVIGRDGLIIEGYGTSGLLLPQVAPEQGWDATELLDGTCEKAGLPVGCWRDPRVRIRRFEAEVFAESRPGGLVVREAVSSSPRGARRGR